ncbi:MAG: metal ABC transporter substrate-binding protein [Elusimicrobia bacterium]|nr:metal ABC transporter substrate-binding protein [Elusimicrobiota bacterium]
MKTRTLLLASVLLAGPGSRASAAGKLRVVATVPELVDITRRVGGDGVAVDGLARGTEDIHQIVMKPSFVTKLNRADAVVYLGLTVEHSFLPGLLDVSRNPRMRADIAKGCTGAGCIDCSEGISVLERPETLSRAEGEIHPQGNPHYNLSPENGPAIARNIARRLAELDPGRAADYRENLKAYLAELEPKLAQWRQWAKSLHGVKAVSYHKDVAYLGHFTGIAFVDTIELKPGVGPTPTHLAQLVREMKAQGVTLIVREQHFERKTCEWLAKETGAKIAVLGVMANAFPGTETFIAMSEHNLKALLAGAGKTP